VGVLAASASRHGSALVDKRRFIPEQWFAEAHKDSRAKCHGPAAATLHPKPQLAAAMLQAIAHAGLVPFTYIVADGV